MPKACFVVLIAALSLVTTACGVRQEDSSAEPPPSSELDQLAAAVQEVMQKGRVPGAAFALIRDGELAGERVLGLADAASGAPVTVETIFEAASLSKPVVAYIVLKIAERGEIDLDRPLAESLPHPDLDDPRGELITARQVLSHTTGLPNWRPRRWTDDPAPLVLGFDPGSRFSYSGEGFEYLRMVIEQQTGSGLEEIAVREVFEPLGMSSSTFQYQLTPASAMPHDFLGEAGEKHIWDQANAAGSLHTTAGDYGRFVAEILRPRYLSSEAASEMLAPVAEVEGEADTGLAWSLGWGLEPGAGTFWHWGDNGDFRCFVMAARDSGDGLVLFTNSRNGLAIAEHVFTRALGGDHPAFTWIDYDRFDSPGFQIQSRLVRVATLGGAEEIAAALVELESEHGDALAEDVVNRIGYNLLGRERTAAAVAVFRWNVGKFPDSSNVYDSLGESLAASGDVTAAIRNYEKSLELNPENENAVAMLAELRETPGS